MPRKAPSPSTQPPAEYEQDTREPIDRLLTLLTDDALFGEEALEPSLQSLLPTLDALTAHLSEAEQVLVLLHGLQEPLYWVLLESSETVRELLTTNLPACLTAMQHAIASAIYKNLVLSEEMKNARSSAEGEN